MKILPLLNSALIFQACFLPKIFWWQIPLGFIAFYCSIVCLILNKNRITYSLLCIFWLVINFSSGSSITEQNENTVDIRLDQTDYDKIELDLNNWQLRFKAGSRLEKLSEISDLQQKQGRISLLKIKHTQNRVVTVAAIELDHLFSGSKWRSNKIFLRRLSSILRQEQGQVIVYMRAKGPYFLAVAKTFAFQARLRKIEAADLLLHFSGAGSDLVFRRQ